MNTIPTPTPSGNDLEDETDDEDDFTWVSNQAGHYKKDSNGVAIVGSDGEHTFGEVLREEPTPQKNGRTYQVCSVCGYDQTVGPPLIYVEPEHTLKAGYEYDATHHWKVCADNCEIKDPAMQHDKASHTYNNSQWTVKTPATYDSTGVEHRFCDTCGREDTRPIAQLTVPDHTTGWSDKIAALRGKHFDPRRYYEDVTPETLQWFLDSHRTSLAEESLALYLVYTPQASTSTFAQNMAQRQLYAQDNYPAVVDLISNAISNPADRTKFQKSVQAYQMLYAAEASTQSGEIITFPSTLTNLLAELGLPAVTPGTTIDPKDAALNWLLDNLITLMPNEVLNKYDIIQQMQDIAQVNGFNDKCRSMGLLQ